MKRNLVKTLLLIVLLLLAVVLGKVLGDVCANVAFLDWLSLSASFGLDPTTLDLCLFCEYSENGTQRGQTPWEAKYE